MKQDNSNQIKAAHSLQSKKAATTDIIVNRDVVQANMQRLSQMPRPKRRRNYAKKIMNDPFIMNV